MVGVLSGDGRCPVVLALPDPVQRDRFARMIDSLPDFRVLATTRSLMDTYSEVEERQPRAVLISSRLAAEPEYEVMRALFATLDVRWVVVRETSGRTELRAAAQPGGSDLFALPDNASAESVAGHLRSVTRHLSSPRPRNAPPPPGSIPPGAAPARAAGPDGLVLIGASTGGVEALLSVLAPFDAACPPTVVLQHTGSGFGESLASLLDRHCAPHVRLARDGALLERGVVLVGAGIGRHVLIGRGGPDRVVLGDSEAVSGHCPSVDALFRSAVDYPGPVAAAVLTGMGKDGAEGLLALRRNAARTIAQDEATSVVFGMPRAAAETGAAEKILPLERIGPALLAAVGARAALASGRA